MRNAILATAICLLAIQLFVNPAAARAQTVNDVREALGDLQRWVEADPVSGDELWRGENGWYKYLGVPQLKQALLLYPHGDRAALEFSLRQLEGNGDSLALPIPQRLRSSLKALLTAPSDPEMGRIETALRQALEQTADVDPKQHLELAKADVAAAIEKVDTLLAKWPPANQAGWREYLRWPLLKEELQLEHVPYSLRLRKIRRLLSQNNNGLERPEFRQLSDALRRLIDATVFYELHFPLAKTASEEEEEGPSAPLTALRSASAIADEEEDAEDGEEPSESEAEPKAPGAAIRKPVPPQDVYRQIVESLIRRMSYGSLRGDGRQNGELNFDLTMGEQYPGIRPLAAEIRKQMSRPTALVTASEAFVNELGTLPVSQTMQVRETILGAQMTGTSTASGTTSVDLKPNNDFISADYLLNSRVDSSNTGVRGKIVACTTSVAAVTGIIKARVEPTGLQVGTPTIHADTNTHIDSVSANTVILPGLISRIATRAAHKQLPQAQQEASRKTEQRISQEFSKQAGERVGKINTAFREKITPFLERRGDIKDLHFRSTDVSAHVSGRIADVSQVSTNAAPPQHHLSGPVIVRIHESLVNNWLETEFAGNIMQVTGASFEFAEDLGLKGPNREPCPEDAESENEEKEAASENEEGNEDSDGAEAPAEEKLAPGTLSTNSILLAGKCPIALSFDHDKVRVHAVIDRAIGKELTQQINSPLEISAIYRISRSPGTIELDRIGSVEVNYFDPAKNNSFTSREYGVKVLLQKRVSRNVLRCKFNVTRIVDRLMERLLSKNTVMTKLRDYEVTNVESEGGWLSLSLDRKAAPSPQLTGTPTPAPVIVSPAQASP